jgi:hypothetical protein
MNNSTIVCETNINNDYNNVLFKNGLLDKNSVTLTSDRRRLYLFLCLPTRFFISLLTGSLFFIKNKIFQFVLSLIYLGILSFGIWHLYSKSEKSKKCQWWSNNYQLLIAIIGYIGVVVLLLTLKYDFSSIFLMIMMIISIIGGASQISNLK